ncbi:MAG: hypothetical protein II054_06320, partial [Treponema sp.]|nr:hypothetical protein [Treponema sp.]
MKVSSFEYEYNGMKISFTYSAKDFVATYDTPFGQLVEQRHMMYMIPMVFSEEFLRKERCMEVAVSFEKTIQFLDGHPDFIPNAKQNLEKLLAPCEAELKELGQKKIEMKRLFKQGQILEKEYKTVLEQRKEMEFKIHRIKLDFYWKLEKDTGTDLSGIRHLL